MDGKFAPLTIVISSSKNFMISHSCCYKISYEYSIEDIHSSLASHCELEESFDSLIQKLLQVGNLYDSIHILLFFIHIDAF